MNTQPTNTPALEEKGKTPVLGILSTVFGGLSMVPLMGIVSPVGLILGIIGLVKEPKKILSIIGTSLSVLGLLTSPVLWGLVLCVINPDECKKKEEDKKAHIEMELQKLDAPQIEAQSPVAGGDQPTPTPTEPQAVAP